MEMKLELVPVPVSDTDRAIDFYVNKVGFHLDHDHKVQPGLRFVQLTPVGSVCSIVIGEGTTEMKPGTQKNLQMVVKDTQAIREELVKNGVDVSEVQEMPWGIFAYFSDPDGNTWALQQVVQQ
ncbi:MAG TPA: VOC family protein [Candidatus Saccharimonadales bacterium]|nr:VOC family protein [Candidatus Saccharimonadales bacterium]